MQMVGVDTNVKSSIDKVLRETGYAEAKMGINDILKSVFMQSDFFFFLADTSWRTGFYRPFMTSAYIFHKKCRSLRKIQPLDQSISSLYRRNDTTLRWLVGERLSLVKCLGVYPKGSSHDSVSHLIHKASPPPNSPAHSSAKSFVSVFAMQNIFKHART
jgi:hypothetical protein